jgi:hypothetical protein
MARARLSPQGSEIGALRVRQVPFSLPRWCTLLSDGKRSGDEQWKNGRTGNQRESRDELPCYRRARVVIFTWDWSWRKRHQAKSTDDASGGR